MSFTKMPVFMQELFMKKLMIFSTSFFCLSTVFFLLLLDRFIQYFIFLLHDRLRLRASEFPRLSVSENLLPLSLQERPYLHSQSCVSEFHEHSTQVGKSTLLIDDDRQDDRPSPSE